jgi:3-oxoacyl-[acyl-carrier protein] reductase
MNAKTQNKVALITGASRGIGAEIARRLVKDGMTVVINYASSSTEADALVNELRAQGGQAIAIKADVSDAAAVQGMFTETEQALGKIDVLVNNAGVMPMHLPHLANTTDAEFDRMFAINVKGTFNTLREAATRMNEGGRVINFSTSVIGVALPGYASYAATKAAVETMSNIFAKEMRGKHITVNAVAPGPTATDLFLNGKDEATIERLSKLNPLERLGQPQDIAAVVSFLAGADGAWVNGQTLRANGGMV